MTKWRRAFVGTVVLFIAVNVVVSLVALLAKLPDLPHTHATTDRITVGTVLWGDGSIVSPPLAFMVVVGVLLWCATRRQTWLAGASTLLIMVGTIVMAIDEFGGDGGLKNKPALYSRSKWDLALILGWIFIVTGVAVVVSGAGRLATSVGILRRPRPAGTA